MNIYPSLMVVDELNLKKEIELLELYCAGFHIDVMDNTFVPNTTWDIYSVNEMVKLIKKQVWLHLMIDNPKAFYEQLFLPVGSLVSFHIELDIDILDFIKTIREKKHNVSIAIRPKTPISHIIPFLRSVDQVLLMSVEPGFSGQSFLNSTFDRLAELIQYRQKQGVHFRIGIDGGINKENIRNLALQGADECAIATAIFNEKNHVVALQELRQIAEI